MQDLEKNFQIGIVNIALKHIPGFKERDLPLNQKNNSSFVAEFKRQLNDLINNESIFNEIYVNVILNPSNSIEYEEYTEQ